MNGSTSWPTPCSHRLERSAQAPSRAALFFLSLRPLRMTPSMSRPTRALGPSILTMLTSSWTASLSPEERRRSASILTSSFLAALPEVAASAAEEFLTSLAATCAGTPAEAGVVAAGAIFWRITKGQRCFRLWFARKGKREKSSSCERPSRLCVKNSPKLCLSKFRVVRAAKCAVMRCGEDEPCFLG